MASLVTTETDRDVEAFIASIENQSKRNDSRTLVQMISELSGEPPKIWGDNFIIGFGKYKYRRKRGKEEFEWFNVGFAPRKSNMTIYLTYDISAEVELLAQLGKSKVGRGCLYINRLDDVDMDVLKVILSKSVHSRWH